MENHNENIELIVWNRVLEITLILTFVSVIIKGVLLSFPFRTYMAELILTILIGAYFYIINIRYLIKNKKKLSKKSNLIICILTSIILGLIFSIGYGVRVMFSYPGALLEVKDMIVIVVWFIFSFIIMFLILSFVMREVKRRKDYKIKKKNQKGGK